MVDTIHETQEIIRFKTSDGKLFDNRQRAEEHERELKQIDWDRARDFELTQTHLDLLKRMYVDWEDCEYGAPAIDCKRPYGNSDVENDIAEIIKFPKNGNWDFNEENWKESASDFLRDLHKQTQIALQIVLCTQSFKIGKYHKKDEYGSRSWVFVK